MKFSYGRVNIVLNYAHGINLALDSAFKNLLP